MKNNYEHEIKDIIGNMLDNGMTQEDIRGVFVHSLMSTLTNEKYIKIICKKNNKNGQNQTI